MNIFTPSSFLVLKVPPNKASRNIIVGVLSLLIKCVICSITLMLWFGHLPSNNLNLCHALDNVFDSPWSKFKNLAFLTTNWALEKYLSINFSSNSFEVWIVPFNMHYNQSLVRPIKENPNKFNFTWLSVTSFNLYIKQILQNFERCFQGSPIAFPSNELSFKPEST